MTDDDVNRLRDLWAADPEDVGELLEAVPVMLDEIGRLRATLKEIPHVAIDGSGTIHARFRDAAFAKEWAQSTLKHANDRDDWKRRAEKAEAELEKVSGCNEAGRNYYRDVSDRLQKEADCFRRGAKEIHEAYLKLEAKLSATRKVVDAARAWYAAFNAKDKAMHDDALVSVAAPLVAEYIEAERALWSEIEAYDQVRVE